MSHTMNSPIEALRIEWLWRNQGENYYNASCTYVSDELKEHSGHYRLFSQEHDVPTEDSEEYDGQAVTITDLWNKVHEREEILGVIDDADISKLREKLSKLVDYKKEVATDGGDGNNDNQDEDSSNLQDLISSVSKYTDQRRILAKLVPRELGEDILHRSAARIRVVWTSCENYSGGIEECWEREQKYSRTIPDQGGPKYTGPVHAYTPLNKFEEGVVEYQCRSPITCIWRKTDEISDHGDIVNKMTDAGWRKSFLDQKRYVIVESQQGPKPIQNKTDTTSKADPEGITAQAADAILKSEQWHIRLFDLPRTLNRNFAHHCTVGQAHRDPWDHDMLPNSDGIVFTEGRDTVSDLWESRGYSIMKRDVGTNNIFEEWDGVIHEIS